MDIDDLLAEVTADAVPRETRDLQELTRAWVAERVSPELLPWPESLMEGVLGRIRKQVRVYTTTTFGLWENGRDEGRGGIGDECEGNANVLNWTD